MDYTYEADRERATEACKRLRGPRYALTGGRWICADGKPLFAVQRADGLAPGEADDIAHLLCVLLNDEADEPTPPIEQAESDGGEPRLFRKGANGSWEDD